MKLNNFKFMIAVLIGVLFLSISSVYAETAEEYLKRGDIDIGQGNFSQAISDYTKAIEINPSYAEAYHNRASAYLSKKDFANATADIIRANKLGDKGDYQFPETLRETTEAENNSGNSKGSLAGSKKINLLEGAFIYPGSYPKPAEVTFKEKNGKEVTVLAIPGQVLVYFDPSVNQKNAKVLIEANGGIILEQIPVTGFYMVGVSVGSEGKFITSIEKDNRIRYAAPNEVSEIPSGKVKNRFSNPFLNFPTSSEAQKFKTRL